MWHARQPFLTCLPRTASSTACSAPHEHRSSSPNFGTSLSVQPAVSTYPAVASPAVAPRKQGRSHAERTAWRREAGHTGLTRNINRSHAHAHDSRTNHTHERRASNGATTTQSRGGAAQRGPPVRRETGEPDIYMHIYLYIIYTHTHIHTHTHTHTHLYIYNRW